MMRFLIFVSAFGLLVQCKTTARTDYDSLSLARYFSSTEDLITGFLEDPMQPLDQTVNVIDSRGERKAAAAYLATFAKNTRVNDGASLMRSMQLYSVVAEKIDDELLKALFSKPAGTASALMLSAHFPGPVSAAHLEDFLTEAIYNNQESSILKPELAEAIGANRLKSSYSLLRDGLLKTGDDAFARAMIKVDPVKASWDFLFYLAQANLEDLRQLNQSTINFYTGMIILDFYLKNPLPSSHPELRQILHYAISRNNGLADLAHNVINLQLGPDRDQLALTLARLPTWVQIAYVESAKRRSSQPVNQFLSKLKEYTPHKEVSAEIRE